MKNSMKKFISFVLVAAMSLAISVPGFAVGDELAVSFPQKAYKVKAAYVTGINDYGTNLTSDSDSNMHNINLENNFSVKEENNDLNISGKIGDQDFNVYGTADSVNENENVIYYNAECSNTNYKILNLTYESNISQSPIYFKKYYQQNPDVTTMLKLYLKPTNTAKKNYIIIEVFGYKLNDVQSIKSSVKGNPQPDRWNVKEFKDISTGKNQDVNQDVNIKSINQNTYTETKTFYNLGLTETHTLTYRIHMDTENMPKGGTGTQKLRITVTGKTISVLGAPNYNSSDSSALHIDSVNVKAASIPNTAFFSCSIDGNVHGGSGSFSASIGASFGPLSVSYNIPSSFTNAGKVDINDTFTGYENGVSGKYVRSTSSKMDSSYHLTEIDDYYEVIFTTRDYGNVSKSGTFKAQWDIGFINYAISQKWSTSKSLSTSMSVK